jgi:hypothetical protein
MNPDLKINSKIIHAPVSINLRQKDFIDNFIMGPHFPWFYQNQQTFGDEESIPVQIKPYLQHHNGPFLSHTLLYRTEDETIKHTERPAKEISSHFEFFLEIFHRFMTENQLHYTNIFRANLNLTWHCSQYHSSPHLDHTWPHKNFILYLTDSRQGHTIIWPDDFSASYMIPCVKFTATTFDQHWHAQKYPEQNIKRVVLVITYI